MVTRTIDCFLNGFFLCIFMATKSKEKSLTKKVKKTTKSNEENRLRLDLLREISILVAGKNTGLLVEILYDKENVNEFLIAKKMGLTINQVRNILYKLSDESLVSFSRKKDKKKGWYTYFWTVDFEKAMVLLKQVIENRIYQLEHKLNSRNSKQFYVCTICKSEIAEENALLQDFTCPECGEIYELKDSSETIAELQKAIEKLSEKLGLINNELDRLEELNQKKVKRRIKKAKKEKDKKRKEAAVKRAKTRKENKAKKEATKKKTTKKSSKKKSAKKKLAKKSSKKIAKKKTTKKSSKKIAKKKSSNKTNSSIKSRLSKVVKRISHK
jgi:transcription factor E